MDAPKRIQRKRLAMTNPNQPVPTKDGWATFGRVCATVLLCGVWLVVLVTRPDKSLGENICSGVLMLVISVVYATIVYSVWRKP